MKMIYIEGLTSEARALMESSIPDADAIADFTERARLAISNAPDAGPALGPLISSLQKARERCPESLEISWVPLLNGKLAIGHRPKKKSVTSLASSGVTDVVTILDVRFVNSQAVMVNLDRGEDLGY